MAVNMAQKHARKAQWRKQMVAEKRRTEQLDATLPARVLRNRQFKPVSSRNPCSKVEWARW